MQDNQRISLRRIHRIRAGERHDAEDFVAVEEPLEIRLAYRNGEARAEKSVSITMRTPGHDDELAVGFLYSEGLVRSPDDLMRVWHRSPPAPGGDLKNVIRADLADGVEVDLKRLERHFYTTSSCGVCGKTSLEALRTQSMHADAVAASDFEIGHDALLALPDKLIEQQKVFGETGGLHAAGLFDRHGEISVIREDVGRHNAFDKLVGRQLLDKNLPEVNSGILVSGRTSFELVQKAAMAGCPFLAAVGAPSSLAIEMARDFGITLVGFLRDGRFNIYSGAQRVNV